MNLFISAMLVLVLANNLLLLYLGWEGVGLCSYLLIGFWYEEPLNGAAARKAFVMTRVGDAALAIGLFLLFTEFGTLDIQPLLAAAAGRWPAGHPTASLAALLLLGGAVGKSAQLPLQTWLPEAMAGPTPISALIHAATMVTAGVYLIARMHGLFELAPSVMALVAGVGSLTLLMAGFSALTQTDIKRILAYSTISQIGYMFLALGVGAWSAAVFHLMTHAYFKALLFLAAGAVIHSYHHEHDIFRMGGLRRRLPVAFWSFVFGSAALVALPFTSGYYSKHEILLAAYAAGGGGWLWGAGVCGALLTGLYSARLVFVAFFGRENRKAHEHLGPSMRVPLLVLCGLSLFGGYFVMPFDSVFGDAGEVAHPPITTAVVTTAAPLIGIAIAAAFYWRHLWSADALLALGPARALQRLWFSGWGLDWLYARAFVLPFKAFAARNQGDVIDGLYSGAAALCRSGHRQATAAQNGQLRWYVASLVGGAVLIVALGVWW
jgi:NADH-quinone oxidoreductase subunit L